MCVQNYSYIRCFSGNKDRDIFQLELFEHSPVNPSTNHHTCLLPASGRQTAPQEGKSSNPQITTSAHQHIIKSSNQPFPPQSTTQNRIFHPT